MIFCILRDSKDYDDIKRKAALELRIAIPTQVMLVKNIFKPKGVDQYAGNLLLKVSHLYCILVTAFSARGNAC